jgi:hypothetical protein
VRPLALRDGLADVVLIRSQATLPETADELSAVARDLGVSGDEIRLGEHATETEIKRLSQTGELSKYRMIHFATHGALAGQVSGDSEPGLLLTPPDKWGKGRLGRPDVCNRQANLTKRLVARDFSFGSAADFGASRRLSRLSTRQRTSEYGSQVTAMGH